MIRLPLLALIVIALALATPFTTATSERRLVVCADPNNLPFSNQAGQGFENKLVELLARNMQAQVEYVWWAQYRGDVRSMLGESQCDVWPGVATGVRTVATTRPYYRASHVFVTRADRPFAGLTLDDKRLKSLSIGVQLIDNDAMNTPPAHAIARRGLARNVHAYTLYGNYDWPNPPVRIVDAVANRNVDVAMVWDLWRGISPINPRSHCGWSRSSGNAMVPHGPWPTISRCACAWTMSICATRSIRSWSRINLRSMRCWMPTTCLMR